MKRLSDFDGNHQNNFTALRLLFAWMVLFTHSFAIVNPQVIDPISARIMPWHWLGGIAVGGFFAISGFLVTASFVQRGAGTFVASRALRLFPCVIVYSLVMIFLLGPFAARVDFQTYWRAEPWANMWNALLWRWEHNLPYVFDANPMKGSTNGSAWTLPIELRCYIGVLFLGLAGAFKERRTANFALLLLLVTVAMNRKELPFFPEGERAVEPIFFFLVGGLAWVNRAHIPMSALLAAVALAAPVAAAVLKIPAVFEWAFIVGFTYVILFAAYCLPHLNVDRFGDISYGLYLYAWPIQQLVWHPGQGGLRNAAYATAIVVPIAYLSWRLVEKPALGLRKSLQLNRQGFNLRPSGSA